MTRRIGMILLLLSLASPAPAAAETVKGKATAKEGDLVSVSGQDIRLFGIDAPDKEQRCKNVRGVEYDCFELSRTALERLIGGQPVDCTLKPSPPTQKLGVCTGGGRDLAALMVLTGYALAYRPVADDYAAEEVRAMSYRRGLWAGRVEPPWLWRSRQLADKAAGRQKAP